MSSLATALVTWEQFLKLPDCDEGYHQELHDGEVVVLPPARPVHIHVQRKIQKLLDRLIGEAGEVMLEFPYRPQPNLQFWYADVAFIPHPDWDRVTLAEQHVVYSPPFIAEVLSPSNRQPKVNRQRIVAFSGGTAEFWVVDLRKKAVQVTTRKGVALYGLGSSIPLAFTKGKISVDSIFEGLK